MNDDQKTEEVVDVFGDNFFEWLKASEKLIQSINKDGFFARKLTHEIMVHAHWGGYADELSKLDWESPNVYIKWEEIRQKQSLMLERLINDFILSYCHDIKREEFEAMRDRAFEVSEMNTYFVFWRKLDPDNTVNLRGESLQASNVSVDNSMLRFWRDEGSKENNNLVFSIALEDLVSFEKVEDTSELPKPELSKEFIADMVSDLPPLKKESPLDEETEKRKTNFPKARGRIHPVITEFVKNECRDFSKRSRSEPLDDKEKDMALSIQRTLAKFRPHDHKLGW